MTDPDEETFLTDQQHAVIDQLIVGKTRTEAAAAVGVSRVTLWRWFTDNPFFVAHLNERRQDVYEAGAMRLRNLAGAAIDVIENMLTSDSEGLRLRAATAILKSVALSDIQRPRGETDPEVIASETRRRNLFKSML